MPSISYTTRPATVNDAASLGALAKQTFVQLLGGFYDPEDLTAYVDGAYSVETMRVEITDPKRNTVLVFPVKDPSSPCGFVMLCDDTIRPGDDGIPSEYLEIKRVYVDSAFHGKGASYALMAAVMKIIKQKNRTIVWLGTGVDNFRAQKFYEKHGFVTTGERLYQVGPVAHADVVMTLQSKEYASKN